jgi:hypothetical protein
MTTWQEDDDVVLAMALVGLVWETLATTCCSSRDLNAGEPWMYCLMG